MLDSGFAPQLVLHFVRNTQHSESKSQSAIEIIFLFFDFHKNQLTLLLLLLQSNIIALPSRPCGKVVTSGCSTILAGHTM